MIELLHDGNSAIDGDVRPYDDLDPEDRPDVSPMVEEELGEQREAVLAEIRELLVDARDWTNKAKAPKIHATTRNKYRASAGKLVGDADALIAALLKLDPTDPDNTPIITMERVRLRNEALLAVETERHARQVPELGMRAYVAAQEIDEIPDNRSRAAGEGSRSPWKQD